MLTKSLFKLARECPSKLHYGLNHRYVNAGIEGGIASELMRGGYQVGELAKAMFAAEDANAIEVPPGDPASQVRLTRELLKQENVTLFEAAFSTDSLFARADILVKRANRLDLIEVKAKSWDATCDSLIGKSSRAKRLHSDWEVYVYDIAFQMHVLQLAHPEFQVEPFLMLVDKTARNSVPGLASYFPVTMANNRARASRSPEFDVLSLDEPLLIKVNALEAVRLTGCSVSGAHDEKEAGRFVEFIETLVESVRTSMRISAHPDTTCRTCEFYLSPDEVSPDRRSGWAECMQAHFERPAGVPRERTIFGFGGRVDLKGYSSNGQFLMEDIALEELMPSTADWAKPNRRRPVLQWREVVNRDLRPFLDQQPLAREIAQWVYPLHFIDFETVAPALPFHSGNRPYQAILFQFSHHRLDADGKLQHASQCLVADSAIDPSVLVLGELKKAIGHEGTVLHWFDHEKTILSGVRRRIETERPVGGPDLLAFLDDLGIGNGKNGRMFDMGRLMERHLFLPGTSGSSSIKRLLPAMLNQSLHLQEKYSQPIYGLEQIPSFNFREKPWAVRATDGAWLNPYKLLGPVSEDADVADLQALGEAGDRDPVADGAAAMLAFAALQNPALSLGERDDLAQQLLRYCELDTLAMVMVYEGISELLNAVRRVGS